MKGKHRQLVGIICRACHPKQLTVSVVSSRSMGFSWAALLLQGDHKATSHQCMQMHLQPCMSTGGGREGGGRLVMTRALQPYRGVLLLLAFALSLLALLTLLAFLGLLGFALLARFGCSFCLHHVLKKPQHTVFKQKASQHNAMQPSTVWSGLAGVGQHSTAQHGTAQLCTGQRSTALHSTAQHSTAKLCTAQRSAQHSTAQLCTAQAQQVTALHSTAQHSRARASGTSIGSCRCTEQCRCRAARHWHDIAGTWQQPATPATPT